MATSLAKENILRKIRQALSNPVPLPFEESEGLTDFFTVSNEDIAVVFAESFTKVQGQFSHCTNNHDLMTQLLELFQQRGWTKIFYKEPPVLQSLQNHGIMPFEDLSSCDVSITGCEWLVARTGSIVMSSAQLSGRTTSVYAPIHICIAYKDQLVFDIQEALSKTQQKYKTQIPSFITFATGPSRTADIEKTLVTGVHGPKEVFCFLVEQ